MRCKSVFAALGLGLLFTGSTLAAPINTADLGVRVLTARGVNVKFVYAKSAKVKTAKRAELLLAIQSVLDAAHESGRVDIPDGTEVTITNSFHVPNAKDKPNADMNDHALFRFNSKSCPKYCAGHAYLPSLPNYAELQPGTIYSSGQPLWEPDLPFYRNRHANAVAPAAAHPPAPAAAHPPAPAAAHPPAPAAAH